MISTKTGSFGSLLLDVSMTKTVCTLTILGSQSRQPAQQLKMERLLDCRSLTMSCRHGSHRCDHQLGQICLVHYVVQGRSRWDTLIARAWRSAACSACCCGI